MTLAKINANIRTIARGTAALNERIQETAVMCIEHAVAHNDANPAMNLVKAVAPRLRQPLVLWFESYSRVNVQKTSEGFKCNISKSDKRSDNVDGARANNWYETAAATKDDLPTDILDVSKKIASLVKWIEKRAEEGKLVGDPAAFEAKVIALRAVA